MNHFPDVRLPGEWLKQTLIKQAITPYILANMMQLNTAQVQHWIDGTERIPNYRLAALARVLIPPYEGNSVLQLKNYEILTDKLGTFAQELASYVENYPDGSLSAEQIEAIMADQIKQLLSQETDLSRDEYVVTLNQYLIDAILSMSIWLDTMKQSNQYPLISHMNVTIHSQYPMNYFIGALLNLDPLRQDGLANLRKVIERPSSTLPRYEVPTFLASHQAIYLLARYGNDFDRATIKGMFQEKSAFADPMKNHLDTIGRIRGLALTDQDPEAINCFIGELQRDVELMELVCVVDAVHYRDAILGPRGTTPLFRDIPMFRQTILHILRHLEQLERYQATAAIEMLTLLYLLHHLGVQPFLDKKSLQRMNRACRQLSQLPVPFDETSAIRSDFQRDFSLVLKHGAQADDFFNVEGNTDTEGWEDLADLL